VHRIRADRRRGEQPVKAPPFAYARAESLDDALALLAEAGDDAKLLAGGQSLVPLLVYRIARPSHLVDIDGVETMGDHVRTAEGLRLGALVRHERLAREAGEGAERVLAEAAGYVGHLPIRMRGTLGGSLAHADPAAELALALLALDAIVHVRSVSRSRDIPLEQLLLGPYTTSLEPGEAIVGVTIPAEARERRGAFAEFAVRSGDFALAAAAVVLTWDGARATNARVALGAVDATPIRVTAAESLLEGAELSDEAIAAAAAVAAAECDPASDPTTSATYRRTLVARLVRDVLVRVREEREAA
jgi:CO/xanthine dehydrogenase FAD-binding subunit